MDGLTGVLAVVDDEPVASLLETQLVRHAACSEHQLAHRGDVRWLEVVDRSDVRPRDDEHVGRCHRANVAKGERVLVLVHDVGGNLLLEDVAEQAAHVGSLYEKSPRSVERRALSGHTGASSGDVTYFDGVVVDGMLVEAGAVPVVAGIGVLVVVADGVAVVLVVDGSPAGLLSLPPQAARVAMAQRTKSFFMMVASRAGVLRLFAVARQGKVALCRGEPLNVRCRNGEARRGNDAAFFEPHKMDGRSRLRRVVRPSSGRARSWKMREATKATKGRGEHQGSWSHTLAFALFRGCQVLRPRSRRRKAGRNLGREWKRGPVEERGILALVAFSPHCALRGLPDLVFEAVGTDVPVPQRSGYAASEAASASKRLRRGSSLRMTRRK